MTKRESGGEVVKYVLGNPARAHHHEKSRDATADGASTNL